MMKSVAMAAILVIGLAAAAHAGTVVPLRASEATQQKAFIKTTHDHPLAIVTANHDVKVVVTTDAIMHSCCMPPQLVVAGDVTNLADKPLDYVKLIFSFENADGKILYTESVYNHKAASMSDDPEVSKILNEKPHFEPLPPGSKDHFTFQIPMPMLPSYAKVEVLPWVANP
jgi:hypothetical protein